MTSGQTKRHDAQLMHNEAQIDTRKAKTFTSMISLHTYHKDNVTHFPSLGDKNDTRAYKDSNRRKGRDITHCVTVGKQGQVLCQVWRSVGCVICDAHVHDIMGIEITLRQAS
jgi:hypothetical protein